MHADTFWNYDDSSLEVTLDSSLVVAIFNAMSEATGLSHKELDGLDGRGSIILKYPENTGSFTIHLSLPPDLQLSASDED